jgi:hypothetical protein
MTLSLIAVVFIAFAAFTNAVNPVLKIAGQGMQLLGPIFALENKLQGAILGAIGKVDVDEVKNELANLKSDPCVIYTYKLSPFSTEAIAALDKAGAKYEQREVGLEWFLLGIDLVEFNLSLSLSLYLNLYLPLSFTLSLSLSLSISFSVSLSLSLFLSLSLSQAQEHLF